MFHKKKNTTLVPEAELFALFTKWLKTEQAQLTQPAAPSTTTPAPPPAPVAPVAPVVMAVPPKPAPAPVVPLTDAQKATREREALEQSRKAAEVIAAFSEAFDPETVLREKLQDLYRRQDSAAAGRDWALASRLKEEVKAYSAELAALKMPSGQSQAVNQSRLALPSVKL